MLDGNGRAEMRFESAQSPSPLLELVSSLGYLHSQINTKCSVITISHKNANTCTMPTRQEPRCFAYMS
jgi:hypothetical protein